MCYDVAYQTKRTLEYAKRRGYDPKSIEELEQRWERVKNLPPRFHASGFEHPPLICFTNQDPWVPQPLYWGLIPIWVRDVKSALQIANRTLNARGETIFDKPSYRDAARYRRCLVMIDHFYEHHHHKGKTYPFLIKMKNDEPMLLGGLWSEWTNKDNGEIVQSVSIVTTSGNELLSRIHNNPKMKGPRMPLVLPKDIEEHWLDPVNSSHDIKAIKDLVQAYPADEMEAYPVGRLRGKHALGNLPEVMERVDYHEIAGLVD